MKWRPTRSGHQSRLNSPQGIYKAPEGWIVIHAMQRQWPGFCAAMGRPELETDERFADLTVRQRNRHELNALIEEWLATLSSDDEAIAILESHRVPCARVIAPYEAMDHPHYESRQMARTVADPVMGDVVVPGNPIRDTDVPLPRDMDAPLLGEHNTEILESLGYTAADADRLEATGVLRRADT